MFKHAVKLTILLCLFLLMVPKIAITQSVIDLDAGEENIRILGDDADDRSGYSVASGDINGDGYDDIIIGADSAGETYVIFGSASLPATINFNSVPVPVDMIIYGSQGSQTLGYSVASGDINGDGYDDVIVGDIEADPPGGLSAGKTYVIFGSSTPPAIIDLDSVSADISIYGDDASDLFGCSVSSGDINGDGYDDVIIGARAACPTVDREKAGETYVIFGSASPPLITDLNDDPSPAGMIIYGDDFEDYSGMSVSSGDINGDGYADVIIGAYAADPEFPVYRDLAGEAYVIFGGTSPSATIDLSSVSADMTIYGDWIYDCSAHSVSSGDINSDGYDDIIIGAPGFDPEAGKTYVIFGSASPQSTINLYTSQADMTIYGEGGGDQAGFSVSSSDINGDSYDDIIIGAPNYWLPQTGFGPGRSYIIYGHACPPTMIDLASISADITILGDDDYDFCGLSVAGGDINGDGCDDVIIGAIGADPPGRTGSGETYVIYGNNLPLDRWGDVRQIGWGRFILKWGKMFMHTPRGPLGFLRVFPKGALCDTCDIKVKMTCRGKRYTNLSMTSKGKINTGLSSSIFFSYQDKRNYWELRMVILPGFSRTTGKWILRHRKNGVIQENVVVKDSIKRRQQYPIHIEVRKTQIKVMIDKVEIINLKLKEKPAWGKVGMQIRGEGVCILEDPKIY